MIAEKAAEILSTVPAQMPLWRSDDWWDAIKLAIEALTWLTEARKRSPAFANIYLPSEEPKKCPGQPTK
jgi:hypothetical protein